MKKLKIPIITLLILFSVLLLTVGIAALKLYTGYTVFRDLRYTENDATVMDIYLPNDASEREINGVILLIHGGSWAGGDKAEEELRCRLLASHGYIAVSINYTLWCGENDAEYDVTTVLDEIDSALAFIADFTADMGINTDRAALGGYSAGAHLALLYSYTRNGTAPLEIKFAASLAGPLDLSTEIWGYEMAAALARIMSSDITAENPPTAKEADEILIPYSPTNQVNENTPPTLIVQGKKDDVVPPTNATSLAEKLSEYSIDYTYKELESSDHSLSQNPIGHLGFYKTVLNYCKTYFGY